MVLSHAARRMVTVIIVVGLPALLVITLAVALFIPAQH
jgi:hypothetical protein